MNMTKRENFFSIVNYQGYEEIPTQYNLCPYLTENYEERINQFKKKHEIPEYFAGSPSLRLVERSDEEYYSFFKGGLKEGAKIDCYGVGHEPGSEAAMHMTYLRNPLSEAETLDELKKFPFAQAIHDDAWLEEAMEINSKKKSEDLIVIGGLAQTIWERAWAIRGMERLMMDMICDEELAEYVLDMVTNLSIEQAEFYARAGCDILWVGDDIGMQKTIMMSEDIYVKWLKPRIKKVIDTAKKINPDILVAYHSCGFVEPFIPHLIEVGVDILNPIQPECMDFAEIHKKYGGKIAFHGTIGTQTTMPFGTPEEVREEVFKNLDIAGKLGGLIPVPTHLLEPEVPVENIEAYLLACKEYKLR